jgi:prevent-host-death family protein
MKDVSISDLSKNCSRLIRKVNRTNETLRITLRGRPIAELIPAPSARKRFVLGDMAGSAEIVGDIVSPIIDTNDGEGRPKC